MRTPVPDELGGKRADLIVARLGDLSRAVARQLIEAGTVLVDREPVRPGTRLSAGSMVDFEPPGPRPLLTPEPLGFDVLYEDEYLAVVDKPAGVVTHPGAGTGVTLAAGILHRWPTVRGVGDEGRWGIVHRLDKETSGALVVALDAAAHSALRSAIRRRGVERRYLALVHGEPAAATGTIDAPVGPDRSRRGRRRVDTAGKPARTHFRVVGAGGGLSLLEVTLETGRTHQIRVHLAAVGLPIAGDRRYGRPSGSPRMFLHAAHVGFDHPITGERLEVECPLPAELREVLATLGVHPDP